MPPSLSSPPATPFGDRLSSQYLTTFPAECTDDLNLQGSANGGSTDAAVRASAAGYQLATATVTIAVPASLLDVSAEVPLVVMEEDGV